jgi:hypothetical protein
MSANIITLTRVLLAMVTLVMFQMGFLSVLLHAADSYKRELESLDLMSYTQAFQHFETAISEDPNKEDVRVSMALTYL